MNLRNLISNSRCRYELTDVVGAQVGELKILIDTPGEQPRGLTHGGCVNPVFGLIAGHELVQAEARNSRTKSQSSGYSIKRKEKQRAVGIGTREKVVELHCAKNGRSQRYSNM